MKEAIAELRSAIRLLRPRFLLRNAGRNSPRGAPDATAAAAEGDYDQASVICDLRLEAASELVDAVASFVWNLDCCWQSLLLANAEGRQVGEACDDGPPRVGDIGGRSIRSGNEGGPIDGVVRARRQVAVVVLEPRAEWNEESKSLVREGYGLLAESLRPSPSSLFADEGGGKYYDLPWADEMQESRREREQREATRTLIRTSILDLLQSLSTSACRHFLLTFLPHFMPLAPLDRDGDADGGHGVPSWLEDSDKAVAAEGSACHLSRKMDCSERIHDQIENRLSRSTESTDDADDVIAQVVETFQSLIQADVTTLVPFLATLTNLFEFAPRENTRLSADARGECLRLCLASLSSVSEHDLPSLLYSLFSLVRSEGEGQRAMEAVRAEWISLTRGGGSETASVGYDPVPYVGHVIVQSFLMGRAATARHLARGFIDAVRVSLRISDFNGNTEVDVEEFQPPLTSLDVMVLIALHSNRDHQRSIESIFDSMTTPQTLSFIELTHLLVQSWLPTNMSKRSGMGRKNSLLYEPLATPLMSVLFYVMISSSSLVKNYEQTKSALVGGLLPFRIEQASRAKSAGAVGATWSCVKADACCRAFPDLYSAVDQQRREQIILGLLSMVSDSFVRSTTLLYSPHNMAKEKRSHNQHKALLRASCAACHALLLISKGHASDLSQIRGAVLDRLLLLASMEVSTPSPNKVTGGSEVAITHHLFDMNCAIIISLLQDTPRHNYQSWDEEESARHLRAGVDGRGSSQLLVTCQKLLFSSSFIHTTTFDENNCRQRVICGLILASRLVRCKLIPSADRGCIWGWVMTIISPTPMTSAPIGALDPEIARWGLDFLRFSFSALEVEHDLRSPEIACFTDVQPICGKNDVFTQVNKMLATAAIIQMEDSLQVPLSDALSQKDVSVASSLTFLAFAEVCSHDYLSQKKKSSAQKSMVICAPYFLNVKSTEKGCSKPFLEPINLVADYVYDLVDWYLELAISKSESWNPRGWLLAKVQLPCCLSRSAMVVLGMQKDYSLELDADLKVPSADPASQHIELDAKDESFQRRWKILFTDGTRSNVALVQNLVEFANCVIVSISVSCAVLKHAHCHFKREETQLSTMGLLSPDKAEKSMRMHRRRRKQLEALRKLLQFSLKKVHTLQRICENIHFALNGFCAEMSKSNAAFTKRRLEGKLTQEEEGEPRQMASTYLRYSKTFHEKRQILLSEVKPAVSSMEMFLLAQINSIHSSILWSCLDDDVDDASLLEFFTKPKPGTSHKMANSSLQGVLGVVRLRRNILRCLQNKIIKLHSRNTASFGMHPHENSEHGDLSLNGISRIFQMATLLTSCFMNTGKREVHGKQKSLTDLGCSITGAFLSAHYKFLLAVFSFATKGVTLKFSRKSNDLLEVTRQPARPKTIKDAKYSWFAGIVQKCAKSISCTDIKEVGLKVPGGKNDSLSLLSNFFLRQLELCEDASISCHIIDLLSILLMHTNCLPSALSELTSGTLCSIYNLSVVSKANLPYAFFIMTNSLTKDAKKVVRECFTQLMRSSNSLLKGKDRFTIAFVHHILAHWSMLILEGASQFFCLNEMVAHLGAFLSGGLRESSSISSFVLHEKNTMPSLNEKTYAPLFEIVLHMIVSSFSLSKPSSSKKKRTTKARHVEGPYSEVVWPLEVYRKLLSIFQSNHVVFPQRFILISVQIASLTVRVSEYQLRQCIQWRNLQQTKVGIRNDFASAALLQPLIDCIASQCIGTTISFCNSVKAQQKSTKTSWRSSYKHAKAVAGLLYRCERMKEILQSICQSQNLSCPKEFNPRRKSLRSMKRCREYGEDCSEKKLKSGNREISTENIARKQGSNSKTLVSSSSVLELLPEPSCKKPGLHFGSINSNSILESDFDEAHLSRDETDNDSIQSSCDDSFGSSFEAIGNWGA